MHSPVIMLPLDLTRATIWEMGREYAELGNHVTDCSLYCGGKRNHHPGITPVGKSIWYKLDEEHQEKVHRAFYWSHFLYGHDGLSVTNHITIPWCEYCYSPGSLSKQDEYVKEVMRRENPNYDREGEFRAARQKYEYDVDKIKKKLDGPRVVSPGANAANYREGMTMAEYVKEDTAYMQRLGMQAKQGFKERFAQMEEIFKRNEGPQGFKKIVES